MKEREGRRREAKMKEKVGKVNRKKRKEGKDQQIHSLLFELLVILLRKHEEYV